MISKKLFLFCLFVVLSQIVLADPPVTTVFVGDSEGIEIEYLLTDQIEVDTDMSFKFHLFNKSNGFRLSKVENCTFFLYDPGGTPIFVTNVSDFHAGRDIHVDVNGNNFSTFGVYNYHFQCEAQSPTGNMIGGFITRQLYVGIKSISMNGWIPLLSCLVSITAFFFVVAALIKSKTLKPLKILFFMLGIIHIFILGFLPYMITLHPTNISYYRDLMLGYFIINGIVLILFIWLRGGTLVMRAFTKTSMDD